MACLNSKQLSVLVIPEETLHQFPLPQKHLQVELYVIVFLVTKRENHKSFATKWISQVSISSARQWCDNAAREVKDRKGDVIRTSCLTIQDILSLI